MSLPQVREPAVAGLFYPDDPLLLQQQVEALLAAATPPPDVHPRALVVPHAGYIYSGPV
ncbi:MAG TPA: AmmeMemoRadiSam system protein B, partial [Gammaproteobacteria bacterium]|nr:AmmeMemoRadiSam system protein B [Gammaproteobacteria bacterium]